MAQVEITPTSLIVHVHGWDQIWSLKSRLEIPLAHVVNAEMDSDEARAGLAGGWKGWRVPGTSVPGVIAAGTFYERGDRVFWNVHNADKAIAIHLAHDAYAKLVIEVDDPESTVTAIRRAVSERQQA